MKVEELNHPLIEHKLAILRDKKTGTKEFRELISEIASVLCYEAMKDVKLKKVKIKTPIEEMETGKLEEVLLSTVKETEIASPFRNPTGAEKTLFPSPACTINAESEI